MKGSMLFGTGISTKEMIDLRSDVVTQPTKEMLNAMLNAEVGNDGWKEDPTVNKFEKKISDMFNVEAALIVPSGTMANEIAIRLLAPSGSEVIVERTSHIYNYEVAGPAVLSGVQLLPLKGKEGILTWDDIKKNIRPKFHQFPETSCISLENTHNNGGGKVYPLDIIKDISKNAKKQGIKMHLDGARLLNACIATNIDPKEYAKHFDIINICLSKSLGCPGASVLLGKKELMDKAILIRRQLGGSMRQIMGHMAAAGIYALDNNIQRLKDDHNNAKKIAKAIKASKKLKLLAEPETSIVLFEPINSSPEEVCELMKKKNILIAPYNYPTLRAVTHLGITKEDTEKVIATIKELF